MKGWPEQFLVEPSSGELKLADERIIYVSFDASEVCTLSFNVKLEIADTEGPRSDGEERWITVQEFPVKAEAFRVDVEYDEETTQNGLDFSQLLVGKEEEAKFTVTNSGAYAVKLKLKPGRKVQEFLSIDFDDTQEIGGGKSNENVDVDGADSGGGIGFFVYEATDMVPVRPLLPTIQVAVSATYNSLAFIPPRGINFRAMAIGSEKVTKDVTLVNDGPFDFDWALSSEIYTEEEDPHKEPELKLRHTEAGDAPFTVAPASGRLAAGEKMDLKVTFNPIEEGDYDFQVFPHIRSLSPELPMNPYSISGHSCYPAINTEDIQVIFEEHFVARTLEDAEAMADSREIRVYCEDDQVFSFGPVLVRSGEFGKEPPAEFRISNPKPIPVTVNFDRKPRFQGGNVNQADVDAFRVSPTTMTIGKHETGRVAVEFAPTELRTYNAKFTADVPGGQVGADNLTFFLRGEGTVPTITLEGPQLGANCDFDFGQHHVRKKAQEVEFVMRNDGIIDATSRAEPGSSGFPNFTITFPSSISLKPKEEKRFKVMFHPKTVGKFTTDLELRTVHNQFENTVITFTGEGEAEPITWELEEWGIAPEDPSSQGGHVEPMPSLDEIYMGEIAVGEEKTAIFHLQNANKASSKEFIRYEFDLSLNPELPPELVQALTIKPSCGHVYPGGVQRIYFTIKPEAKFKVSLAEIPVKRWRMTYPEGVPEDPWNNERMMDGEDPAGPDDEAEVDVGADPAAETPADPDRPATDPLKRARVPIPEPGERVEDSETRMDLKLTVAADERAFECDTNEINFKRTVLFSALVHTFSVKNLAEALALPFEWTLQSAVDPPDVKGARSYSIEPSRGTIKGGQTQEFSVKFAPEEVYNFDAKLIGDFGTGEEHVIMMHGSAKRPLCHFEPNDVEGVPLSGDYLDRRLVDLTPLDPRYKIIEINALGTKVKNSKRFYVRNPTGQPFEFYWMEEEPSSQTPFRCLTRRGTILPGKKYLMHFEYTPLDLGIKNLGFHEAFWTFVIPGPKNTDVKQEFLVVGQVKEPRVGINVPSHNFGSLFVGAVQRKTVRVVNKEHIPFSFEFRWDPAEMSSSDPPLKIFPMRGTVGPESSAEVELIFEPHTEDIYNINLICDVKRKQDPVLLNIKGKGYKLHHMLTVDEFGMTRELQPGVRDRIDFGEMQVNERRDVTLKLKNKGPERPGLTEVDFDFIMKVKGGRGEVHPGPDMGRVPPYITVQIDGQPTLKGKAVCYKESEIQMTYRPMTNHFLDGALARIAIPTAHGEQSSLVELAGRARAPAVDFSFRSYDFGSSFIRRLGIDNGDEVDTDDEQTVELHIHNRDTQDVLIDTDFERLPHLDVQMPGVMIPAGARKTVLITFSPRELRPYHETVVFRINDFTEEGDTVRKAAMEVPVEITGRGVQMRLELLKPSMQSIDFGTVTSTGGEVVTRSITLVNRGPKTCHFELSEASGAILRSKKVSWDPSGPQMLRPKEQLPVTLVFAPESHLHRLERQQLVAKTVAGDVPLCQISGKCHATEIRFSVHSVVFGGVVERSTASRKVHIHNFGDLGSKFRFEIPASVKDIVRITPMEGYVNAMNDEILTVSFHAPRVIEAKKGRADPNSYFIDGIKCVLDTYHPVPLTVTGRAIKQPTENVKRMEFFGCTVRDTKEQTFQIDNTSDDEWRPVITVSTLKPEGQRFWSCTEDIVIPARGKADVTVKYRPLSMASEDNPHEGQIFVATPDGGAFMYELVGSAAAPDTPNVIQAEVKCKTRHQQAVPIKNWLHARQKFQVKYELLEPAAGSPEAAVLKIGGADVAGSGTLPDFDLPASLERPYKFAVYAHKAIPSAAFRLEFTNPETGEFVLYDVRFTFVAPDSLGEIRFDTSCRQENRHAILVENPLSTAATFTLKSSIPDISFAVGKAPLENVTVPPKTSKGSGQKSFDIVFKPLSETKGEERGTVTLQSAELGDIVYDVVYKVGSAGPERSVVFKAPLGMQDPPYGVEETFTFRHFSSKPTKYTAKIQVAGNPSAKAEEERDCFTLINPDASADKQDQQVDFRVLFKPSSTQQATALLVVESPECGTYRTKLSGFVQPPQATKIKTPFAEGKPTPVKFRNPFSGANPTNFTFSVDNPAYELDKKSAQVAPKGEVDINVTYKKKEGGAAGGRIMVKCASVPTPWVFFLEGA